MIDFEDTLFEGFSASGKLSLSGKASGKVGKKPAPKRPAVKKPVPPVAMFVRPTIPAVVVKKPTGGFTSPVVKAVTSAQKAVSVAKQVAAKSPSGALSAPARQAAEAAQKAVTAARAAVKGNIQTIPRLPALAGKAAISGAALSAINKPSVPMGVKEVAASKIALKAITSLKKKTPKHPPSHDVAEKAEKAIAPIAHACGCGGSTKNVRIIIHREMAKGGMPPHSADSLLAMLHDMNKQLETAATQRLATFEHQAIVSKRDFEHEVLERLSALSKKLPECHPVRTRAQLAIYRKAR